MGTIIGFVSQKGGVGKSTLSRAVAREAANEGLNVKIADLDINVINIYIPPQSSCPQNFQASISPLLDNSSNTIIIGDINAHDDLWSPGNNDPRGDSIADQLDNNNQCEEDELVQL